MCQLLIASSTNGMADPVLQKEVEKYMIKLANNNEIRECLYENYITTPIKKVVPFASEETKEENSESSYRFSIR